MSASTVPWTQEKIEKLVELYKQYPLLWDPVDQNYKNRSRKNEALKTISSAMNVDMVEVERKLAVLTTQFRRAYRKVVSRTRSGMKAEEADRHVWYGYKLLDFLKDKFKHNAAFLKSAEPQNVKVQPQSIACKPAFQSTAIVYPPNTIIRNNFATDRPRVAGLNDAILVMNDLPNKQPPQKIKDEYDLYGEQIACKLRKMDEITRVNTQHLINNVIHDAEMKELNKRYGLSPTHISVPMESYEEVVENSELDDTDGAKFCVKDY